MLLVLQEVDVARMNQVLRNTIERASNLPIAESRFSVLNELIQYVQNKIDSNKPIHLNFICTHNSRRSQLSQIWAKTAAHLFGMEINTYSGGVEVTAFNERAVDSCRRLGFDIDKVTDSENPQYMVHIDSSVSVTCFSKVYDNEVNPSESFAAVMTCSDADENCPFIPGTEKRIPLRYEDPKAFDGTELEAEKYDERSLQIASELLYVFKQVTKS